jgi:hypothetical protein
MLKHIPRFEVTTMYGLDTTIDLSFLKGNEIIQIAIGIYQVIFVFDNSIKLSVESEFTVRAHEGDSRWQSGRPSAAAPALRLLGASVKSVEGQADGTLELVFSEGMSLKVFDNTKEYESYTITRAGQTIVV